MGQRVEIPAELADLLTQRARVLERRHGTVILEMPDIVADVTEAEKRRLSRRFRWLWGQRWLPDDD